MDGNRDRTTRSLAALPRVLLVDAGDDAAATVPTLIATALDAGLVTSVSTPAAFLAAASRGDYDVVVFDIEARNMGGITTLGLARAYMPSVPLIILVDDPNGILAREASMLGAQTCVRRGDAEALVLALSIELGRTRPDVPTAPVVEDAVALPAVWQALATAVLVLRTDGTILTANAAAAQLLGPSDVRQLVGLGVDDLVVVDGAEPLASTFLRGGARGDEPVVVGDHEVTFQRRSDPARLTLRASAAPLPLDDGLATLVELREVNREQRIQSRELTTTSRAHALTRVAARLNAQLELEAVVAAVCEEAATALDAQFAVVTVTDRHSGKVSFVQAHGLQSSSQDGLAFVACLPFGRLGELHGRQQGAIAILPDVELLASSAQVDVAALLDSRTLVGVPLRRENREIGTLTVGSLRAPRTFTADELSLLLGIADQAAQAITNARLYADSRRRSEHLQALHAIDLAANSSLDQRVVLNVVLEQVIGSLGVHLACVLLVDPITKGLEYVAGRGFRGTTLGIAQVRTGDGLAGRAVAERRTIMVDDLEDHYLDRSRRGMVQSERLKAAVVVPLVAKGQVKGVLELYHREALTVDPEWRQVLEALATQAAMAIDSASLFESLQRANSELLNAYDATIEGWSRAMDLRDQATEGHSLRVAEITLRLARQCGLGDDELLHMRRGALLHDIGKMIIPDHILRKAGPLSAEEQVIMRQHPRHAHELLAPIGYLRPALDIPYCHHEWWDGTGYPRGLRGEQIPLAARIFAVADVWDALNSDRSYRPAWSPERALEHIRANSGTQFDWRVVEALVTLFQTGDDILRARD